MMIRFRKLHLLGLGSYGNVHLAAATSASNDDHYSILPFSLSAVKSANFYSSFAIYLAREKKFLDEVHESPYVIQCFGHDVSIEKGKTTYNLMMEYASGGTLGGLIRERGGRIVEAEVGCYTAMLLEGLSCVHGKGIVHCDMKPDNILVFPIMERSGVLNHHLLKIADFGLAKKLWEDDMIEEAEAGEESSNRGALLYASPESILLGLHTTANDVWALGCIVFEMLIGQPVWRSSTVRDLIAEVVGERPEIPEFVSDIARDFLEKCLDKHIHNRWTIRKLLRHPFIFNNARHFRMTDHLIGSRNPFGFDDGRRRTNTFSDLVGEYAPHTATT